MNAITDILTYPSQNNKQLYKLNAKIAVRNLMATDIL